MSDQPKSPIKSGWRGAINGSIELTENSGINVDRINLWLDFKTAWALCNLLDDRALENHRDVIEIGQLKMLSNIGASIGRLIDHPAANNGGRKIIK